MFFGVVTLAFAGVVMAMGDLDVVATVLGVGLVLVALNEYRGAALLGRLHAGAPVQLAAGQAALGTLIIGYCVWSMVHIGSSSALSDPQIRELDPEIASLAQGMATLVYVLVIAATVLFQGAAAIYYLTRRGLVRKYVSQTPGWIVEFDRLRAGG